VIAVIYGIYWTHPDREWTKDEEKKAEGEVRDKIRLVVVAAARLSAAREGQRVEYSHRLREIDDGLLV
jgi:hypothetical protein